MQERITERRRARRSKGARNASRVRRYAKYKPWVSFSDSVRLLLSSAYFRGRQLQTQPALRRMRSLSTDRTYVRCWPSLPGRISGHRCRSSVRLDRGTSSSPPLQSGASCRGSRATSETQLGSADTDRKSSGRSLCRSLVPPPRLRLKARGAGPTERVMQRGSTWNCSALSEHNWLQSWVRSLSSSGWRALCLRLDL